MAAKFCVDCGLPLTGRYCGACGRDYGATDAAQRASCPLATVQQDSSSTAGAQQEVAEAQQDVSSSTAGAQPAGSPASRPCAREGGGRAHGAPRSLSAPAATRGRGPGSGAGPAAGGVASAGGFTLSKNITSWRDGPMGCFLKPMSAAAASDGALAIEEARSARDALFSTKLSETLRKQRDESAGIKARTTLASQFFVRQFKIRGGSGFGKGTGGGRPAKNDKLLSNRVGELAKHYGVDQSEFKHFSPFDWWCQNPAVDQMYREHNWDRTIEPQGQEDGIRTQEDTTIAVDDVAHEETWEEDGKKTYFRNDLVKELLRSAWYEWDTKGNFLRLKTVKEWRIACQSKFGTPGPSKASAHAWRTKEDERVKAWTSGTELPGAKLAFKSPPNVLAMVSEIERVREQAKQMTRREEPTTGRPSKLSPSMYEDLKTEVRKAHALLGFNVMTVQLAAHKLLMSKLEPADGEDSWMPSDSWAQW